MLVVTTNAKVIMAQFIKARSRIATNVERELNA